ncbi:MAG: peptidoglycan DD-metalloendopeptidase family protein [Provencibacterium sp.]|jgi:murein DD-endopeptidase MepM/ murein hydrolase activator NlpD|nr:peptidoglycan DD-metalloendopeptidase family protein [Provencibacterium sp.]
MGKKRKGRRTALLLALLLSLGTWTPVRANEADDIKSKIEDLNDQLEDIAAQKKAVQSKIANTRSDKEKKLLEKTEWETQIQLTRDEIAALDERIALLEEAIKVKEGEIGDKQADIEENYALYRERIRAMYLAGESSTLSMVLGASDFTDFLMRTEVVRSTAQHDRDLLERLKNDRLELEEAQQELEENKSQVKADRSATEEKKAQLEDELDAVQDEIQDIALLEQAYLADAAKYNKMEAEAQAALDAFYAQLETTTEYVGGEMSWPVPGFSTISSSYGWRFNNTNFHTGIDIASTPGRGGIYGASIKAANTGKIVLAQGGNSSSGYGNYVIVDHGGGRTTLYGHMSSISVSVGQTVARGEEIGKVGSTGWATGPHLHFEVRIDGKHANPISYLQG